MGHSIEYYNFPITESKDLITEVVNRVSRCYGDARSNLPNNIRWLDSGTPFACYDDAVDYINRIDRGDYDQIAVRYRATPKNSKDVEETKQRLGKAQDALRAASYQGNYPSTRTSRFISCPGCKSKFNTEKLAEFVTRSGNNRCPLCRHDLRPNSTIEAHNKRLAIAAATVDKALEALHEVERRAAKDGEIRWCIKIEYHI